MKVIPCFSKICNWLLNSFLDHCGFIIKEILVGMAMCSRSSKRLLCHAHIIHYRGPMGFVVREAEEVFSL